VAAALLFWGLTARVIVNAVASEAKHLKKSLRHLPLEPPLICQTLALSFVIV